MSSKLIKCKSCGADIAKSAKTCPSCGAKNKSRHPVLGIIIAIIGIFIFVQAISGGSKPKLADDQNAPPQSKTEEPEEQEKTEFGIGERVDLNNIIVTLVDVSENSGENYLKPADGKKFLICEFEIQNDSTSEIAVSSIASFEAYVDDYSTQINLSAMVSTDKTQLDGTVAAGKKMNGIVGYEVPSDWKTLEINFTPDFWSGKDIKFIYEK